MLQTSDNPTNNLIKPTTPADIVEAIKYIIHGCDRSKPDVTIPAASQPIVGKYICQQFITPLLEEIAQLNTDKQHLAAQLAYLSHVRLDDWSRNNPVQTNPPPAAPSRIVKFEIDGVQWYSYTSSSDMPGMSYYTAFPVYVLVRDIIHHTLKQFKYPDGLTMGTKPGHDIIGYRFINESDAPYYNTPTKPTTQPTLTPSDKDRIVLAKWFAGNDTGISSKAMAAVYLAGTAVFDKGTDNTPRDAPDLGRCIRLVVSCPSILLRPTVYTLGQQHPVWREYLDHWTHLVTLFNKGDYHVTTGYMDVLRDYANGKANYKIVSEYYRKHTVDPLQHIKDALAAGRQVQRRDSQDHQWYYTLSTLCPYTEHAASIAWYNNPDNYRVLLNHTDITPTTVLRNKGTTIGYVTISEVTEAGVFPTNTLQLVAWSRLADTAEYSHDGVTWKPCGIPPPSK